MHACTYVCTRPQAYNITNDAPLPFWSFISRVLSGLDLPSPSVRLPYLLVYGLACLLQLLCLLLSPVLTLKPTFTPMRVSLAATHHYYSCQRAKEDFSYEPVVPFDEGLRRAVQDYRLSCTST